MALEDEKYIAFTTFAERGSGLDAGVGVRQRRPGRLLDRDGHRPRRSGSAGTRRSPCSRDVRGRVRSGTTAVLGTAEMVQSGRLFDEVHAKVHEKYGLMTRITPLFAALARQGRKGLTYADTVVLVRPDA